MNQCMKTEGKCNESINNEFNEEKQFITSNNESQLIMKLTQLIHVCLIIFNSLFWYNEFTEVRQVSQSARTCSKLTIETLKQGVKYV